MSNVKKKSNYYLELKKQIGEDGAKDISGYEGLYAVTRTGRIWSYPKIGRPGRYIKTHTGSGGYKILQLSKYSSGKTFKVHRLVASTFLPNPMNKSEVNHLDGNKTNNHVDNLEWCTPAENNRHAITTGLWQAVHGEKVGTSKLTDRMVREIKDLKGTLSQRVIARQYKTSQKTIGNIHKGYSWKHIE